MAKIRTQFLCNSCGSVHPKWMGKCPDCGTWDSLEGDKGKRVDSSVPLSPTPLAPLSSSTVLYVTSEESARQTKLRASRLGVESPNLLVLAETNVERIVEQIHKVSPAVVVIDSIQMI